ncbi:hypothetical protein [Methylobacterium nodulans]|uniref:Uncharacterized protein n=1 Tax=Methylobacterium nodulans (strain LMG 21967 / CNCM I-2342 / ORS 2060) TaxID=460265 RepID=B8IX27_METNO|nr:hypothetical protein [Methylobacterium nodulans]ACL63068.1 hypothetical protein Mnod_8080 [Methylobacterium nodulans ORS 2060]
MAARNETGLCPPEPAEADAGQSPPPAGADRAAAGRHGPDGTAYVAHDPRTDTFTEHSWAEMAGRVAARRAALACEGLHIPTLHTRLLAGVEALNGLLQIG